MNHCESIACALPLICAAAGAGDDAGGDVAVDPESDDASYALGLPMWSYSMSLIPLPVSAPSKSIFSGMTYLVSGAGVLSPPVKSPISPVTSGITPSPLSITVVTMDSASLAPLFDAFELVSAESSEIGRASCRERH